MEFHILYSRPHKFKLFSFFIRLFEGWIGWSHVSFLFYSQSLGRHLIYEASPMGVRFIGFSKFKELNEVVKAFQVTIDERYPKLYSHLLANCVDYAGHGYGFLTVFGYGITKFVSAITFGKVKIPMRMFTDGVKTFYCSELLSFMIIMLQEYVKELDHCPPPKGGWGIDLFEKQDILLSELDKILVKLTRYDCPILKFEEVDMFN